MLNSRIHCPPTGMFSQTLKEKVNLIPKNPCPVGAQRGARSPKLSEVPLATNYRTQPRSGQMSKTEISKLKSSTAGLRFHDLRHHAITDQRNHRRAIKPLWSLPGTRISPNAGSLLARAAGSEEDCTGRNLDTRSDR